MTRTRFVVTLPDDAWVTSVSREHSRAAFRLLAAVDRSTSACGLVWITAPDVTPILDSMDRAEMEYTVLHRTSQEAAVQFETPNAVVLAAAAEAGVPIVFPIETSNGQSTLDAVGDPARMTTLAQELEATCPEVTVAFVREQFDRSQQLTHRQRTLVTTALEMGYYDTPRRCSLTALADELDLAKSTISETLHRAEEVIVKDYFRAPDGSRTPI